MARELFDDGRGTRLIAAFVSLPKLDGSSKETAYASKRSTIQAIGQLLKATGGLLGG